VGETDVVLSSLRPCFRARNPRAGSTVVGVAAGLGRDALPWAPELLHLARTEDEYYHTGDVRRALAAVVMHSQAGVEPLLGLLREPEPARRNALGALAALGPRAAPALPVLREMLAGADEALRVALEGAIRKIEEGDQPG
jgi:hypothetical protein